MTTHDRATLKRYFMAGARPTEEHFAAFIESALVMDDEGFEKTLEDGLRIITKGESTALMCFQLRSSSTADWSIGFPDNQGDSLLLKKGALSSADPTIMTFHAVDDAPRVRIGTSDGPQAAELDVVGAISSDGRLGRAQKTATAADGEWRPITGTLHGCVAIEVMAGVGLPGSGRFALLHAVAMNTYNPVQWEYPYALRQHLTGWKKPIRSQHAFYSRAADCLKLRWAPGPPPPPAPPGAVQGQREKKPIGAQVSDFLFGWRTNVNAKYGKESSYHLQIKTRSNYGDGKDKAPNIQIFTTKLWYDPEMTHAPVTPPAAARRAADWPIP